MRKAGFCFAPHRCRILGSVDPRFHTARFGVLLNTSLNRRGEPTVCSYDDALNMFFGSDLQILAIGDFLVRKAG